MTVKRADKKPEKRLEAVPVANQPRQLRTVQTVGEAMAVKRAENVAEFDNPVETNGKLADKTVDHIRSNRRPKW